MVNEKVNVKDKYRTIKKSLKIFLIVIIIGVILAAVFLSGFLTNKPKTEVVLENPLKDIVFLNTNAQGQVDRDAVVNQGITKFNEEYIDYLLVALGVNNLHKSVIGYGDPEVEFVLDNEAWSSRVDNGNLMTKKTNAEDADLRITMTKKEAVEALLSSDIEDFMKNSVSNGNIQIEMLANVVELGSKGYLKMYKDLTGKGIEVENTE